MPQEDLVSALNFGCEGVGLAAWAMVHGGARGSINIKIEAKA